MQGIKMSFSERLVNHFVGLLIEELEEVNRLWFELRDGYFNLNIHGTRYVNYALWSRFEIAEVRYSIDEQTLVFRQTRPTEVRGQFFMGEYLSRFVDDPLGDYLEGFEFVEAQDSLYTFVLRKSESMRSFFDTTLTGRTLTELFPFEDITVRPEELIFRG